MLKRQRDPNIQYYKKGGARKYYRKAPRNVRAPFQPFQQMNVPMYRQPRAVKLFRSTMGGTEIKAVDIPLTTTIVRLPATPPTSILLNGCLTGAGYFNRIGAKINMKSIRFRGSIELNSTVTKDDATLRWILFYDKQTNKVVPTFADVIQSRDNAGAPTNTFLSDINMDYRDRFIILRDKMIDLPYNQWTANTINGNINVNDDFSIDEYVKLSGLPTLYNQSTGLIGDVNSGGLFFLIFANGTDSAWKFEWQTRLRFHDT